MPFKTKCSLCVFAPLRLFTRTARVLTVFPTIDRPPKIHYIQSIMKPLALLLGISLASLSVGSAAEKKSNPSPPPQAPATAATPTTPPATAAEPSISGKATIVLRSDVEQYLSGLELLLIPDAAAPEIRKVREDRWRERASRFRFNDGYNNLDLQAIGVTAIKHEIARTTVGPEGQYQFKDIKPGAYRIYGQYKSKYAAGYWLIPVTIKKAGDSVKLDIQNSNLAEIYNYQK